VNTNLRVLGLFKKKKAYPSVEDHARAGRIVGENDTGGNGISIPDRACSVFESFHHAVVETIVKEEVSSGEKVPVPSPRQQGGPQGVPESQAGIRIRSPFSHGFTYLRLRRSRHDVRYVLRARRR
jgi:hypothetical protein